MGWHTEFNDCSGHLLFSLGSIGNLLGTYFNRQCMARTPHSDWQAVWESACGRKLIRTNRRSLEK